MLLWWSMIAEAMKIFIAVERGCGISQSRKVEIVGFVLLWNPTPMGFVKGAKAHAYK